MWMKSLSSATLPPRFTRGNMIWVPSPKFSLTQKQSSPLWVKRQDTLLYLCPRSGWVSESARHQGCSLKISKICLDSLSMVHRKITQGFIRNPTLSWSVLSLISWEQDGSHGGTPACATHSRLEGKCQKKKTTLFCYKHNLFYWLWLTQRNSEWSGPLTLPEHRTYIVGNRQHPKGILQVSLYHMTECCW